LKGKTRRLSPRDGEPSNASDHGGPVDRARPELTGVRGSPVLQRLRARHRSTKRRRLARDSDREVGWRRGAHDLAGSKVIKQRQNELRRARHLEMQRSGTGNEMRCSGEWMRWRCFLYCRRGGGGEGSGGGWLVIEFNSSGFDNEMGRGVDETPS
jgi:hypothetical protein